MNDNNRFNIIIYHYNLILYLLSVYFIFILNLVDLWEIY